MKLEEVLPAYRAGKKVKRKQWARALCAQHEINDEDIMATDWEVINDPITITREQFERAVCKVFNAAIINVETFDRLWSELKK